MADHPRPDDRRPAPAALFLAAALACGGLRDPRLFAVGGAMVAALLWRERPPWGPAAAWLPWLGWAAASAAVSAEPLAAPPVLARWAAAMGFMSLAASWDEEERAAWVKTLIVVAAALAAAAAWTGARAHSRPAMTGLLPPYYNYTAFALAAASAAAATWALHPAGPRGAWRAAALSSAVVGAACVAAAHSRGAALGLGAAALAWALRRRTARWGLAVAACVAVAAWAWPNRGLRDYWIKAHGQRGEARPGIWRAAARTADESPWLGEGPGNFAAGFRRHPVPSPRPGARWGLTTEYAHSEPLQAAAETGWIGLILWAAALAASLRFCGGGARREPAREAAASAAVAMAAQLSIDNMLQVPGLAFLFFGALGASGGPAEGRRWPRWAAAACGALALVAWIPRSLAADRPALAMRLFPTEPAAFEEAAYRAGAEADALWSRAEWLAPFDAVYPWRRAQIAAAEGRWADAETLSDCAVELEPRFLRARLLRAEALARLGRREPALAEAAQIRRFLETPVSGEYGYEKVVTGFDAADLARLSLAEALARGDLR